ncbi:SGS1 [Candida pseudojiufengensis]|uniref:SGS1 n=1 Tax=Candida pseudojiufengensis TaxID=497109 RepID=UPI002224BBD4|nr:SGS1 [Candida pseudojiufengensis]KAI5960041.1 SGS1 [Candida pseudojiufengensis]
MIKSNNLQEQLDWARSNKPHLPKPDLLSKVLKKYPAFTPNVQTSISSTSSSSSTSNIGNTNGTQDSRMRQTSVSQVGNLLVTTYSPDSNKENVPPASSTTRTTSNTNIDASFTSTQSTSSNKSNQSNKNNKKKSQSVLPLVSRFFNPSAPSSRTPLNTQSEEVIDLTFDPSPKKKRPSEELNGTTNKRVKLNNESSKYKELISLQDTKINLLEEKFITSESTSISLDQKKEIYKELQNKVDELNKKIKEIKDKVQADDEQEEFIIHESAMMTDVIEDSVAEAETQQQHEVFRAPARPARIAEARQILEQDTSILEGEDNFGDHTMDGLKTPTQDRDDYDDMGSFIDDDEGPVIENSEDEFESIVGTQTIHRVDRDELDNIRLSPDVAEKYGIRYDDNNNEDHEYVGNDSYVEDQLAMSSDDDGNEEEEFDEVEEVDFSTQLNQEREIDIISIDSDEDNDEVNNEEDDVEATTITDRPNINVNTSTSIAESINATSASMISKQTNQPQSILPPLLSIDTDDEFSEEDEDLLHLINATKERVTPPGSESFINEIYKVLNTVFKLQTFRPNQLEAIVASLLNKDVFVLMPTGGGKSLCYQLSALIKGGLNKGTTVVISPLISLMQDQVQHLIHKNVKAGMISSKASNDENKQTINLFKEGLLDIVYLSPEKVNRSSQIQKIIGNLYDNNKLARVVIDEAHCLSSWGHDFRPDYKDLCFFKEKFPNAPIMALTATANERVRMDIIHHLKMKNPVTFKQSFNRTNLFYEVRWKANDHLQNIFDYIQQRHKNKCGIIYCHSKVSCEQTSSKLNQLGLKTSFYHAGMTPEDRLRIQTDWQKNKLQLICATVAFGMGIDKPDVRFVIHLTIPRSLEGYYQETGRAGRDGKPSECIMYFNYRDGRSLISTIKKDRDLTYEGKQNHLEKLGQVLSFCDNKVDCRRKIVLQYFNETFNSINCNKQCDNCKNFNHVTSTSKDCTEHSKDIVRLVQSIQDEKVTVVHCQDMFKGLKGGKIGKMGHQNNPYHGKGKNLDKSEIERIFFNLIGEGYLEEYQVMRGGFASNYVKTTRKSSRLLNGQLRIQIVF